METWEEVTAAVKQQSDIIQVIGEHVNLRRSGVRYLGLCPFHQEKTPSFSVHQGQQFYYCFSCKAAGDVFTFVMNYHHLEFMDALKLLADRCNIVLPQRRKSHKEAEQEKHRERLFAVNSRAASLYHEYLCHSPAADHARRYLSQRGISEAVREQYQLGYAPSVEIAGWNFLGTKLEQQEHDAAREVGLLVAKEHGGSYDRFRDRLMCPICDARGRVAGFGGRILGEGNPKYLNSPESLIYNKSRLLFGLFQQRDAIRKLRRATLVEGNFDLLALVTNGYESVVAPLGTALTREQVRLLKALADEVILLFDGDNAGLKAAERAAPFFLAERVSGKVALLPEGHDPDTFIRRHGLEALNDIVGKAETLPEFVLNQLVQRHGVTLDGKTRIIEALRPLLAAADAGLQRSMVAAHFASLLGVEPKILLSHLTGSVLPGATSRIAGPLPDKKKHDLALSGGLRRLISFMILNPAQLPELEKADVAEVVSGSVGEIILLQLRQLVAERGPELQPEELLSALPEGEERALVSSLLLEPGGAAFGTSGIEEEGDWLDDVVSWLRRLVLKKRSDDLMNHIVDAQKDNNFKLISELMARKMEVDAELKSL